LSLFFFFVLSFCLFLSFRFCQHNHQATKLSNSFFLSLSLWTLSLIFWASFSSLLECLHHLPATEAKCLVRWKVLVCTTLLITGRWWRHSKSDEKEAQKIRESPERVQRERKKELESFVAWWLCWQKNLKDKKTRKTPLKKPKKERRPKT